MDKIKVSCEIEVTIQMIGGKCKPLILYYLAENGTKRFNELMAYITQISQKTLTNQLRELEGDGASSREKSMRKFLRKSNIPLQKKGDRFSPS